MKLQLTIHSKAALFVLLLSILLCRACAAQGVVEAAALGTTDTSCFTSTRAYLNDEQADFYLNIQIDSPFGDLTCEHFAKENETHTISGVIFTTRVVDAVEFSDPQCVVVKDDFTFTVESNYNPAGKFICGLLNQ